MIVFKGVQPKRYPTRDPPSLTPRTCARKSRVLSQQGKADLMQGNPENYLHAFRWSLVYFSPVTRVVNFKWKPFGLPVVVLQYQANLRGRKGTGGR